MGLATWTTTPQVARRMSLQAQRDTRPELAIRSMLHAAGLRYRVSYPVPELSRCSIDIAFTRRKLAVFVDGCFWHACPEHGTRPKANAGRWAAKLAANQSRDRWVDAKLGEHDWRVLRIWEHEDVSAAFSRILFYISELRMAAGS